jgi:hypothetical protein
MRSYATFQGFTRGCIQVERAYAAATRPDDVRRLEEVHLNWALLPTLRSVAPYWTPSLSTDADFQYGIRTIIAGMRTIRTSHDASADVSPA